MSQRASAAPALAGAHAAGASTRARTARFDPFPYLLLAPATLLIGAFALLPAAYAIVMSFYRVNFVRLEQFVGFDNYQALIAAPETADNVRATLVFALGTLAGAFLFGIVLALVLNEPLAGRGAFRAMLLIPWVTSQVVSTMLVRWLLDHDYGLINAALVALGFRPVSFLSSGSMAMLSLIGTNVWRTAPFAMVLMLAALQTIPAELHEAASVDGASWLRRLSGITLPLIRTQLLIIMVVLSLGYVQSVTPVLVLTGGGPGRSTEVLSLRMWVEAFTNFRMDRAATVAVSILGINVVLSAVYLRVLRGQPFR